jgi:hypothetical protein
MKLVRIWLFDPGKLQHRTRISPDSTNDGARSSRSGDRYWLRPSGHEDAYTNLEPRPRASVGAEWTTS